jgi:hypothetical protein
VISLSGHYSGLIVLSMTTYVLLISRSTYTVKKVIDIPPSPAGKSLTKLSLAENNLIIPGQRAFGQ